MLELVSDPNAWIALATLTALELVLGIDNIVFISILVDKLPAAEQKRARLIGLFLAMFMRVGLLLVLSWIIGLTTPLFTVLGQEISGRDLILIGGGLFLIWKSTAEIHQSLEGAEGESAAAVKASFLAVTLQIVVVGVVLIAEGFDHHVPKGYIYFAMAFSVGVEMLNIRMRRRATKTAHPSAPYVKHDGPPKPP